MKQNLNLLIAIREKELRQKEFAEIVGIHPNTLSSAINGRINMSLDEKARCAKALGKSIKEIFPLRKQKKQSRCWRCLCQSGSGFWWWLQLGKLQIC